MIHRSIQKEIPDSPIADNEAAAWGRALSQSLPINGFFPDNFIAPLFESVHEASAHSLSSSRVGLKRAVLRVLSKSFLFIVLKKILTTGQALDTKVLFDFSDPQEYADIK